MVYYCDERWLVALDQQFKSYFDTLCTLMHPHTHSLHKKIVSCTWERAKESHVKRNCSLNWKHQRMEYLSILFIRDFIFCRSSHTDPFHRLRSICSVSFTSIQSLCFFLSFAAALVAFFINPSVKRGKQSKYNNDNTN